MDFEQFADDIFPLEEMRTEVSHIYGPAIKCPGGRLFNKDGTERNFPDRWWQYNDGGRWSAGFFGHTGDCVTRAIAIATQLPYRTVYDEINELATARSDISTSWLGVSKEMYRRYIESLGWAWNHEMARGTGFQMHLNADELPSGRLIVQVTHHLVAVIDGVIHDTYDCSRGGTRGVYGYFIQRE